jgi:hypothetical protein
VSKLGNAVGEQLERGPAAFGTDYLASNSGRQIKHSGQCAGQGIINGS